MDAQQQTRSCCRERIPRDEGMPRGSKQICLPMTRAIYDRIWDDPGEVRRFLEPLIHTSPELFPDGMPDGFQLTGRLPESEKMPGVRLRQFRLPNGRVFSLRPSFVMSYISTFAVPEIRCTPSMETLDQRVCSRERAYLSLTADLGLPGQAPPWLWEADRQSLNSTQQRPTVASPR